MTIKKLGHSSFFIKGKKVSLVTDPFDPRTTGLPFPKVEADIVLVSHDHPDHNYPQAVNGGPFIISGPGEYEIKGVNIFGLQTFHDEQKGELRGKNTVYQIIFDEINLVHCGDLGQLLAEADLENFAAVDVLIIPVGGVFTVDAAQAAQITTLFQPKIVIPCHYRDSRLSQKTFGQLAPVKDFLKEIGQENVQSQQTLSLSQGKLPEETTVIVLE